MMTAPQGRHFPLAVNFSRRSPSESTNKAAIPISRFLGYSNRLSPKSRTLAGSSPQDYRPFFVRKNCPGSDDPFQPLRQHIPNLDAVITWNDRQQFDL